MLKNAAVAVFIFIAAFYLTGISNDKLLFEGANYYTFSASSGGAAKTYIFEADEAAEFKKNAKNIDGEAAVYLDGFDYEKLLAKLNAKVKLKQTAGGILSIYAYSPKIKKCLSIDGKSVNLHIAVSFDRVCVGSPIIFTSY